MMPHVGYKVLHLLAIFVLFAGLGGLWALVFGATEARDSLRRLLLATHGVALLLILFAGFGMLARLGIMGSWPAWVWIKLVIWLLLGASPALLGRVRKPHGLLLYLLPLLGAVAAWAALFRIGGMP